MRFRQIEEEEYMNKCQGKKGIAGAYFTCFIDEYGVEFYFVDAHTGKFFKTYLTTIGTLYTQLNSLGDLYFAGKYLDRGLNIQEMRRIDDFEMCIEDFHFTLRELKQIVEL